MSLAGERPDSHSDSGKSPSGGPDPVTPKPARRHHCSQCGMRFSLSGDLKRHEKKHTGEKPFQCSQCGKSFTCLGNLNRHEKIHAGEKPFQCTQSEKSFAWLRSLKKHQRIHAGEKPFQYQGTSQPFDTGCSGEYQNCHQ